MLILPEFITSALLTQGGNPFQIRNISMDEVQREENKTNTLAGKIKLDSILHVFPHTV